MSPICGNCGKTLRGGRRFPFATLGFTHNQSANTLNVSGSTWQDYMCHGVSREAAERIASRLGVHPYELWPEMLDHDLEAQHRTCKECGRTFLPSNGKHRYCSRNCAARAWQRRRYHNDPEWRARDIAKSRAYYDENGNYCRNRQRAYRDIA